MLAHIFWKGFWKNKKNFILMACSGMLMISVTFFFMAFNDLLMKVTTDEPVGMAVEYAMTANFLTTGALLQFLMVLAAICYMRTRAGEYGMLDIMGIRKKHRRMFMAVEYVLLMVLSIGGGILLGYGASGLIKRFLAGLYPERTEALTLTSFPLRFSLISGAVFFLFLFIICDELIACLGAETVLNLKVKSGRRPKKHPLMWKIGAALLLAALLLMQSYWGRVNKQMPTLLTMVGVYLLYVSLGGILLVALKKKESRYYKKILWLNTWYHRFYQNLNMMFLVTVLVFMAVFLFAMPILDTNPLDTSADYPYDVVWMANEEDGAFLAELEENYGAKAKTVPCIRVTAGDQTEHMAVSESVYEAWTKEDISLGKKEILVNYQRDRGNRNGLGIDYGAKKPRLAAGCNRRELWIYTPLGKILPSRQFDSGYRITEKRERILTGNFGSTEEHILVFTDEEYAKLKEKAKGADLAVLLQIPQAYDEVMAQIAGYAAEHSQRDFHTGGNLLYPKREMVEANRMGRLLGRNISGINLALVLLCALFVTLIKVGNDSREMEEKYGFYFQMGMNFRARKRGIRKECHMTVLFPALSGMLLGVLLVLRELSLRKLEAVWLLRYLAGLLGACLILGGIYGIVAAAVDAQMIRRAGKKEGESHV